MRCITSKELLFLISIFQISQEMKDILEEIHPSEDNPSELNDFFEDVMKFKEAFKMIRRAAAESDRDSMARDRRDKDIDEYIYDEDNFVANTKKPLINKHIPSSYKMSPLSKSSRPLNDVYPHIYKEHSGQEFVDNYRENFDFDKGPRYRRQLAEDVEVEPKSTKGNIAVVGEKATMVNSKNKAESNENDAHEALITIFSQLGKSTYPTHEVTTPSFQSSLPGTDVSNSQRTVDVPVNIILTTTSSLDSKTSPITDTRRSVDLQKENNNRELKIGRSVKEYSSDDKESENLPKQSSNSLNTMHPEGLPNAMDPKKDHSDTNKNNLKADSQQFDKVESVEIPPSAPKIRKSVVPTEFVQDIPKFVHNIMDEIQTKYRGDVPKNTRSHHYHYGPYIEPAYSDASRNMYYAKNSNDMIYKTPYYQQAIQQTFRKKENKREDSEMQPEDDSENYRSRSLKSFDDTNEDLRIFKRNAKEILGMDNEDDYIEDLAFATQPPSTVKSAEEDEEISSSKAFVELDKIKAKSTPTNYANVSYSSTSTPATFPTTTTTLIELSTTPSVTTPKNTGTKISKMDETRKYRMLRRQKLHSRLRKRRKSCQANKRRKKREHLGRGYFSLPRLRRHRCTSRSSSFDENHNNNMHRLNGHDLFFIYKNVRTPQFHKNFNNDEAKSYYSNNIGSYYPNPEMYQKMRHLHFQPYSPDNQQSGDIYPKIYEDDEGRFSPDHLKAKDVLYERRRRCCEGGSCRKLMASSNCTAYEHIVQKRDVIDSANDEEPNALTKVLEKRSESDYGEEPDLSEGQNFKKHSKLKKYNKVSAPSKNFDDNYEYEEVPKDKTSSFLGFKKNCASKKKCKKQKLKYCDHHTCQQSFRDREERLENKLFSSPDDEAEEVLREELPYEGQYDEYRRSERQSEPIRLNEQDFSGSSRPIEPDEADADNKQRQFCNLCGDNPSASPPHDFHQPCAWNYLPPLHPSATCPCPPSSEAGRLCILCPEVPPTYDARAWPGSSAPSFGSYSCSPPCPYPNNIPNAEDMNKILSNIKECCRSTHIDPCPRCNTYTCPSLLPCVSPGRPSPPYQAPCFTSSEEVKDDMSIGDGVSFAGNTENELPQFHETDSGFYYRPTLNMHVLKTRCVVPYCNCQCPCHPCPRNPCPGPCACNPCHCLCPSDSLSCCSPCDPSSRFCFPCPFSSIHKREIGSNYHENIRFPAIFYDPILRSPSPIQTQPSFPNPNMKYEKEEQAAEEKSVGSRYAQMDNPSKSQESENTENLEEDDEHPDYPSRCCSNPISIDTTAPPGHFPCPLCSSVVGTMGSTSSQSAPPPFPPCLSAEGTMIPPSSQPTFSTFPPCPPSYQLCCAPCPHCPPPCPPSSPPMESGHDPADPQNSGDIYDNEDIHETDESSPLNDIEFTNSEEKFKSSESENDEKRDVKGSSSYSSPQVRPLNSGATLDPPCLVASHPSPVHFPQYPCTTCPICNFYSCLNSLICKGEKEKRKCPKTLEPLPPFSACTTRSAIFPPLPLPYEDTTNDMLAQKAREVNAYLKNQYLNGRYTMNNRKILRNRRHLPSLYRSVNASYPEMETLERPVRRPHAVPKKPSNKKLPTLNEDLKYLKDFIDDNDLAGFQESNTKRGDGGMDENNYQVGKIHRRNSNDQDNPNPEASTKSDLNPEELMLLHKKSNSEYQDFLFARDIVEAVMNKVNKNTNLKIKIGNALNKKRIYETEKNQKTDSKKCSFGESAEYEESKNLLRSVSCVMNKLVKKQIDEKLCEKLPGYLKCFLKRILRPPKHRINQRHDSKYHEDTFLFRASCPPAKIDANKRTQLEGNLVKLLDRYDRLDEDSKKRAAPLRSYIANHLDMLRKISDDNLNPETSAMSSDIESDVSPQIHTRHNHGNSKLESSRNGFNNLNAMEKNPENLDINKKIPFDQPPFGMNSFTPVKISEEDNSAENKLNKRNSEREISPRKKQTNGDLTSDKYKKLLKAAEEVRVKRRNEEKIGEAFGNNKVNENDPDTKEQEDQVAFETPLVYRT